MSTWTTPITWANAAVTASQMNAEIKDHLNHLKGGLDLLTNSTFKDTNTAAGPYLSVTRNFSTSDTIIEAKYVSFTNRTWFVTADGYMGWSYNGVNSSADIAMYPESGNILKVASGQLRAERTTTNSRFFDGVVTGDAQTRLRAIVLTSGGGQFDVGDGTTNAIGKFYYDVTNTQVVLDGNLSAGNPLDGVDLKLVVSSGGSVGVGTSAGAASSIMLAPSTTPVLQLGVASIAGSTASNYLGVNGQFRAQDGLSTKVNAGAISDATFSPTPVSGTLGVDTTNDHLAVRSGSTWRGVDLRGAPSPIGPFVVENMAASVTNGNVPFAGWAGTSRVEMPIPGHIIGISARVNATIDAGDTLTLEPNVSGTGTGYTLTLDNATSFDSSYNAPATNNAFSSGQTLGVFYTTNSGFSPAGSIDCFVFLFILLRRGLYS